MGVNKLAGVAGVAVFAVAGPLGAQSPGLEGRWTSEPDKGVVVRLDLSPAGALVIPGEGPGGKVQALTLALRELRVGTGTATFTVVLPDDEGTIEFEFQRAGEDAGVLKASKIDGQPADDDLPTWRLQRAPR